MNARQLGREAAQVFTGPHDVFGRGVSHGGMVVWVFAFLHSWLYVYSITATTVRGFQALWTAPAVFGATVWDVSALVTLALGLLLLVEAWGEVSLRSTGWIHRLTCILFSLLLVGSLGFYLRSVTAVLEHFMVFGSRGR